MRIFLLALLFSSMAWAQSPHDPISLLAADEGVHLTGSNRQAGNWNVNCVGTPITCTWNGSTSTLTLTVSGTGGGITTLNTLTADPQLFAVGTTGTDFNISSATATHTFHLPTASGTARGALASADWTTFNDKQATLSTSAAVANQFLTAFTAPNTFSRAQPTFANLASTPTTLAGYGITDAVPATRNVNTTGPLGGGGALSGDLTLTCTTCLTSVTAHNLLSTTHGDSLAASPVLGDILHGNVTPAWARLAGNITTTKNFLTQTGDGAISAVPAWGTIASGDLPSHNAATATALAGDPTDCAGGEFANAIAASGNLACAVPSGTGANTALSNLAAVAINLPLLPDAAAADDFGSATLPFKDIFFAGSSGTPGTNNFRLTGTSTSGTRVITAADGASVTVIADAGAANNFLTAIATTGVISKAQPSASNLSDGTTGTGAIVLAGSPTFTTSALSPVFSGTTADPADAGVLRLSNGEQVCWEASPTGVDFCITGDSSERIAATTFVGALVGNADTATSATTATTATTANAGDSATAFFASGNLEAAISFGGAPGADDQVLVSDTTSTATWRSIPNCNTENMLTYATGTNTWGCEADTAGAGGGDAITVNTTAVVDPDFITSSTVSVTENLVPAPDTITWAVVANSIGPTHLDETVAYTFSSTTNTFVGASYTDGSGAAAGSGVLRAANNVAIFGAEAAPAGVDGTLTFTAAELMSFAGITGLNIPTGATYQINSTQIACANLSDSGSLCTSSTDFEEEGQLGTTNLGDNAADDEIPLGSAANTAAWQPLANGALAYATATNAFSQAACADLSDDGSLCDQGTVAAGQYDAASIDGDDINANIAGTGLTLTAAVPDTLDCDAASTTAVGCMETAIASEVNTGTDAGRAVSPDALAGSNLGTKTAEVIVFNTTTAVTTGDNKVLYKIPPAVYGMSLIGATAGVNVVSSAGGDGAVNIDLARCLAVATGNACSGTVQDLFSTNLTIDQNEDDTETAASAVAFANNTNFVAGEWIRVDVDLAGTGVQGLNVIMEFRLP